jgi:hypothetical protein
MRSFRPLLVVVIMALGLGLPAAAAAQSAGDEQYADPFEETPAQNEPAAPADDGDAAAPQAPTPSANTAAPTATSPSSSGQLPYTGLNLVLVLATGLVLLLTGFTMRRVLTGPYAATR